MSRVEHGAAGADRLELVLLTGIDHEPVAAATLTLGFDLPHAVTLTHHLDPEAATLRRVVADITGVLEDVTMTLEHACTTCALREDVLPTLERLAADGRWRTALVRLPVGASADQLCSLLAWDAVLRSRLVVQAVVAALAAGSVTDDLLGDQLMVERGRAAAPDDERGVGEVACDLVEHADVVVLDPGDPGASAVVPGPAPTGPGYARSGRALLTALARPGTPVLDDPALLGVDTVRGRHDHDAVRAWNDRLSRVALPALAPLLDGVDGAEDVWRVELRTSRAFHPERLLEGLEDLGAGEHRSRGCFWLPTRPDRAVAWDGAGGQLSIGSDQAWRGRPRHTRLVLTGVGDPPPLRAPFERMLLGEGERVRFGREDGFEPWLGPLVEGEVA